MLYVAVSVIIISIIDNLVYFQLTTKTRDRPQQVQLVVRRRVGGMTRSPDDAARSVDGAARSAAHVSKCDM